MSPPTETGHSSMHLLYVIRSSTTVQNSTVHYSTGRWRTEHASIHDPSLHAFPSIRPYLDEEACDGFVLCVVYVECCLHGRVFFSFGSPGPEGHAGRWVWDGIQYSNLPGRGRPVRGAAFGRREGPPPGRAVGKPG